MATIPIADRAMLGRTNGGLITDWNGTVADRVRQYLLFFEHDRGLCYLEAMTPVRFSDDLPARAHLIPSMIEQLAERLSLAGEL